jgi:hypothetical protein
MPNPTVTLPYTITLDGCLLNGVLKFPTEPFHNRESLTSTLRGKVLRHVAVEFDEKALDKALEACNSIVEPDGEDDNNMTFPCVLDYENDRLNFYDIDEELGWREKHDILRGVDAEPNEELDIEALIRTALSSTLDR